MPTAPCATCAGVTLASFVLALVFFTSELLLFKTLSWKMALQPMVVAGAMLRCKAMPLCLNSLDSARSADQDSLPTGLHTRRCERAVDGPGPQLLPRLLCPAFRGTGWHLAEEATMIIAVAACYCQLVPQTPSESCCDGCRLCSCQQSAEVCCALIDPGVP
jgi:Erg28 like protein